MPDSAEALEPIVDAAVTDDAPIIETPIDDKPVIEQKTVEQKPVAMEDTIRAKFRELNTPKVEEKPPVDRARDPLTGKFIETPAEKAAAAAKALVDKPVVAPKPDDKLIEQKPAVTPPADVRHAKAPSSWKGAAQAKWDALDPEVKAQAHQREEDFHKGIAQYKQKSENFDALDAEIRPYEAMIRAAGTNPQTLIRDVFNTIYQMKTGSPEGKIETWLEIGKSYGIDMNLVAAVQEKIAAGQPVVSPEVVQLKQQLSTVQGTLENQRLAAEAEKTRIEQEEFAAIQAEAQAFGADPKNTHFSNPVIKQTMAALISNGQAKDYSDAYNKAIWTVPEVRELLLAEQRKAESAQAAEKAAAAKRASSTNVVARGTPPANATPVVGTMEDTIRATFRKLTGTTS